MRRWMRLFCFLLVGLRDMLNRVVIVLSSLTGMFIYYSCEKYCKVMLIIMIG